MTTATMTKAERAELISDLRSEIESIDADVYGWKVELEDAIEEIRRLKAEIAAGRARKVAIREEITKLRTK